MLFPIRVSKWIQISNLANDFLDDKITESKLNEQNQIVFDFVPNKLSEFYYKTSFFC